MDSLVRTILLARSALRHGLGVILALALSVFLVTDLTWNFDPRFRYPAALLFAVAFGASARARYRQSDLVSSRGWQETELGMFSVLGLLGLAAYVDGNLDGSTYPVMFIFLVLLSVLAVPWATAVTVGFAISVEAAVRFIAFGEDALRSLLLHGVLASAFSLVGTIVIRAEVARIRTHSRNRLDAEIERMHSAARSYRLLGATARVDDLSDENTPPSSDLDANRLARSSVEEIHQAVLFALQLLHRSLGLHTAMLLWLSDASPHLRISELSSDADNLLEGPFPMNDGIFGAVVTEKNTLTLSNLKASYSLPYYTGACPVRALAAVPVMENDQLRGLLVTDRKDNVAFSSSEQDLLLAATRYMLRAIQNERVFVQLERAKVEQGKLYRAARALGSAMSERDVVEAGVRSAREIASFDFAAVTLFDEAKKMHVIRAVSGDSVQGLVGVKFRHNAGLVSMVVQNKHPLPYRGHYDPNRQVVFAPRVAPAPMSSLLVLPLLVHERPLGTLVLGARRPGALGEAVRPTLEVLASHVAVSLSGARMMKRLEELATRDGLTGLFNKRALLEMSQDKLAAAKRFSRKLSLLVVDIDHFKKVNDTYGHDQGDVVLKGLGVILRKAKRTTDAVARFGGEEFIILCEETDREGAMLLAERIREELQQTTFQTPKGELSVTCSIGIATFPDAGTDWDTLFKAADEALYVSKRSGRNRCTAWSSRRGKAA
ncbi:MAG TPA: sensor domain-containing diguanylate cyclase [Polyangiaceae bacterium]|jgi:diguanylate cyclase (GGDEF)-like protein|nr:MAG: Diguanylate cyclase DosC [Deltaproteobacteria bacterium ADurb.Bin207]HNS95599.1 sensor domain-containing diguanylate cyclase [Polyangiaceae bacterium]HNZ21247.1 sensor domain-containing diguanylate cyclase [Polyangiaceae bacterium]HOD21067.1 sensor domain-containing diguanylate cyclase [Polyangiaceae bacterium]HOE48635.1 sensor domain-containing diguanylate cyclase [Polyangiaceae bacterium]